MKIHFTTTQRTLVMSLSVVLASGISGGSLLAQTDADPTTTASTKLETFPDALKNEIKYVIVLYPENRSFDSLYGQIPGANGLAQAKAANATQTAQTGAPLAALPQPTTSGIPGVTAGPDARFPAALPNAPYSTEPFVPTTSMIGDMVHRFYTEQYQINDPQGRYRANPKNQGGAPMSKMSAWSDNPGLVMSHYDAQNLGEGALGKQFVLGDNMYHSAFGGSFLNHQFLIAARAPVWPANPPAPASPPAASNATVFDANGYPSVLTNGTVSDGLLTGDTDLPGFYMSNAAQNINLGDYWAVNTVRPLNGPAGGFSTAATTGGAPTSNTPLTGRLPLQTHDTIGDRLSAAGISWAWYSGGWNDAKAGRADYLFQFHHQPFAFFANYALATTPVPQTANAAAIPGTDSPGSAAHLKDEDADFYPGLADRKTFPRVVFVKPIGENNSHPGYAAVARGQNWVGNAVAQIQASPIWKHCVIFITYDEHGGLWDHVQPPRVDSWGPGLRVPFIVVSPFAKNGFIDHTQYETDSLLTFIEKLHGLPALNEHDANAIPPTAPFAGEPDLIVRGQVGKAFSYAMPAYGDPTPTKLVGDLDGLTYDASTGTLSGMPEKAGSYAIKVRARHTDGSKANSTMRLDVLGQQPQFEGRDNSQVAANK